MNYGYEPTPQDEELAEKIREYLATLPPDNRGMYAYVERDGSYQGVRVRRISHYPEDTRWKIVKECDAIYAQIVEEVGGND